MPKHVIRYSNSYGYVRLRVLVPVWHDSSSKCSDPQEEEDRAMAGGKSHAIGDLFWLFVLYLFLTLVFHYLSFCNYVKCMYGHIYLPLVYMGLFGLCLRTCLAQATDLRRYFTLPGVSIATWLLSCLPSSIQTRTTSLLLLSWVGCLAQIVFLDVKIWSLRVRTIYRQLRGRSQTKRALHTCLARRPAANQTSSTYMHA